VNSSTIFTVISFYALVVLFFVSVILLYRSPARWHILLTIFLGFITAFIDAHSSEVSFSLLLLLSFGFFLGFMKPTRPFRTALLFSIWLPVTALIHIGIIGTYTVFFNEGVGSLLAIIPALGGSYLGSFIRKNSENSCLVSDPLH